MKQVSKVAMLGYFLCLSVPAQSDAEKFAEGRIALDNYHDCKRAINALEGVSSEGRKNLLWVYYMAKAHECAGNLEQALSHYEQYNVLAPGQPAILNKIGDLRYRINKLADERVAAEADRKMRDVEVAEKIREEAQLRELSGGINLTEGPSMGISSSAPTTLNFSADSRACVIGWDINKENRKALTWHSVTTGSISKSFEIPFEREFNGLFASIHAALSPDGTTYAVAADRYLDKDKTLIWIIDSASDTPRHKLRLSPSSDAFGGMYYSRDGRTLLVRDRLAHTLQIRDIKTGRVLRSFSEWGRLSPDSRMIALLDDNVVKFIDVESGRMTSQIEDDSAIYFIRYSPDGNRIALANPNQAKVWDINTHKIVRTYNFQYSPENHIRDMEFSSDGTLLFICTYGDIDLWHVQTGKLIKHHIAPGGESIALSPNGRILGVLLRGSDPRGVKLFNITH